MRRRTSFDRAAVCETGSLVVSIQGLFDDPALELGNQTEQVLFQRYSFSSSESGLERNASCRDPRG